MVVTGVSNKQAMRRFNKRMFFFFGPPQLGDTGAAAPVVERDPVCPHCGTRESAHTIFRDAAKSFAQCPVDPGETAHPK
jgi:hypothetical protein